MLQGTRTISRPSWIRACAPRQGLQQQMPVRLHPLAAASNSAPNRAGRNIVLAIDTDAQGSYKALQYTLQHIYRQGDVLHLLHVVPASSGLLAQGQCLAYMMPPEEGLQEQMAARAKQYFEQHYMQLAQQSGATVELDLVHGSCRHSVTNTICEKVQSLDAELVVLPIQRKRSFIEDLFQAPISKQVAQAGNYFGQNKMQNLACRRVYPSVSEAAAWLQQQYASGGFGKESCKATVPVVASLSCRCASSDARSARS